MQALTITPIGVIRTPYVDRYKAPRQPGMASVGEEGRIELVPGLNMEQAIEDLAGFDRIWVVVWFHRNTEWRTRVLPPRGGRTKRSVLATRSPHRPNPIGLSVLRLLGIEGRTLRVADVDLLDGTPVLDIKPYVPYADAFADSKAGWLDDVEQDEKAHPGPAFVVRWSVLASEQRAWLRDAFGVEMGEVSERALMRDPAPHPYRRIMRDSEGGLMIAEKSWRLHFLVEDASVEVTRVSSGYRAAGLVADDSSILDAEAHRAFHLRWGARES